MGGDYFLTLKANQGQTFAAVQAHVDRCRLARGATVRPVFDTFDDGHGRSVRRRVFVFPEAAGLDALQEWRGLRTVLAVETIRTVNGSGKAEADVTFREDDSRVRDRSAARNLALLRKIELNLVAADRTPHPLAPSLNPSVDVGL